MNQTFSNEERTSFPASHFIKNLSFLVYLTKYFNNSSVVICFSLRRVKIKMNAQKVENDSCSHLTSTENEEIFKLLGEKCRSISTSAIAEVFETKPPNHMSWSHRISCGVLCFEKDNLKRSYFFRSYCLQNKKIIWEHEIYRQMDVIKEKPFLITFEGEVSVHAKISHFDVNKAFNFSAWNDCVQFCV